MIQYTIAMSIRVVCIVLMLFVEGWWQAVCVAGAIILPYIAVVLANVGTAGKTAPVIRPGALVPLRDTTPGPEAGVPFSADQPQDPRAWPGSDEDKRSA